MSNLQREVRHSALYESRLPGIATLVGGMRGNQLVITQVSTVKMWTEARTW